jgi:iron-sulfur cluster insertion protein
MTSIKNLEEVFDLHPKEDAKGFSLKMTQRACQRLATLCESEKEKDSTLSPYLRLKVQGGGCAGFQFYIDLALAREEDEIFFSHQGIEVGIDLTSLELLSGSTIDYEETLMGSAFVIRNPNAQSSCGCGNSFSLI